MDRGEVEGIDAAQPALQHGIVSRTVYLFQANLPSKLVDSWLENRYTVPVISQNVMTSASPHYHTVCGESPITICDTRLMEFQEKNGGPNHLKAWREYRGLTQQELADAVKTTQHQIAYLESGERGLSGKWLRRLAPALRITPGFLLDQDPSDLSDDIIETWTTADDRKKQQIAAIIKAVVTDGKTGTAD